jgi:hypothetical protein
VHLPVKKALLLTAALVLAGALAWSAAAHPWGWLYGLGVHPYPASSSTPWTYQLWSGFLPALTVLSLLGSLAGVWHLHNCHERLCWRLGKHKVGGTPWCSLHREHGLAASPGAGQLDDLAALLQRIIDKGGS